MRNLETGVAIPNESIHALSSICSLGEFGRDADDEEEVAGRLSDEAEFDDAIETAYFSVSATNLEALSISASKS